MQIDSSSASVLSALSRADALTEQRTLALQQAQTGATLRTEEQANTAAQRSGAEATRPEGAPAVGLSAVSVTVAQAAPELENGESEADAQNDAAARAQIAEEQPEEAANQTDGDQAQAEEEEQQQVQAEEEEGPDGLTDTERAEVRELERTDAEVRRHEAAHATVGGQFAGPPTFTTVRGPNGQTYAVAGEVRIDTSPVPGNPEATIEKLEQVRRAAQAPADPSAVDRRVASQASQGIQSARIEARNQAAEEQQAQREAAQERRDEETVQGTADQARQDLIDDFPLRETDPTAARNEAVAAVTEPDTGTDVAATNERETQSRTAEQSRTDPGTDTPAADAPLTQARDPNVQAAQAGLAQAAQALAEPAAQAATDGSNATERTDLLAAEQTDQRPQGRADQAQPSRQDAQREQDESPAEDGRAALQRALFEQEPQTRTLLGQRAFEDAIRLRDTVNAETQSRADRNDAEQVQRAREDTDRSDANRTLAANDLQRPDDGEGSLTDRRDQSEATVVTNALISGQRASGAEQGAPSQRLFA